MAADVELMKIYFIVSVCLLAAEAAVEFKWISLTDKNVTTSDSASKDVNTTDGDVTTHVTITSEKPRLVVDLRSSSSEVWVIYSVSITPARPPHKTGVTGLADKKDTSKCVFPFKKNNKWQNKCVDSGFGFKKCSFGGHVEISDWSSCNSDQPNGSLSDNITVLLSISEKSKKPETCGTTDDVSLNTNRIVKCPHIPTYYLVLTKHGDMQLAEINVKAYSYKIDDKIKKPDILWKAEPGDQTNNGLSISGIPVPFIISKINWYHQPLDSSEEPKKVDTTTERKFVPSRITYKQSGYYHFEYANSNDETFYKSNRIPIQVFSKSIFTTKLKSKYSGYACPNKYEQIICAVGFGYPHPIVTMKMANKTLPCNYTTGHDTKYGGKSVNCSLQLPMKSNYNNLELICRISQGDVQEYVQESSATLRVEECNEDIEVLESKPTSTPKLNYDILLYSIIGAVCLVLLIFIIVVAFCCCRQSRGTYV